MYHILRYKNDLDDLTFLNNISVAYLWLIKDAELVTNKSFSGLLDYSYDDIMEKIVYLGNDEELKRVFEFLYKLKIKDGE